MRGPAWLIGLRRRWRLLVALAVALGCAAVVLGPHVFAWYHWRAGREALERYRAAEARRHLDACLRVWPASAKVHLLAARAARRAGDIEGADRHLRACERLGGGPEAVLEGALLRAAGGGFTEATEAYLLGRAEREPDVAPLAWEALVTGYIRTYRALEGLACLRRWLEREPDNVQALVLRGDLWRRLRNLANATPDYRRALELDPGRDDARRGLAAGLTETGRYDEALRHYDVLAGKGQADPDFRVSRARCYKGLGRLDEARREADGVLAGQPDHGHALRLRGEVDAVAGNLGRAEQWFRKAARALPHDYSTQFALYQNLRQQGKEEQARAQQKYVEDLKERVERLGYISSSKLPVRPHDPDLHHEVGMLYLSLGQEEVGTVWLHTALHKDPAHGPAHAALADFYARAGDAERASYHREQAQLAPPRPPRSADPAPGAVPEPPEKARRRDGPAPDPRLPPGKAP